MLAADRARKGEGPTVLDIYDIPLAGDISQAIRRLPPGGRGILLGHDRDPLKLTKAILLEREQVEPAVLQAVEEEEEKHVQEMLKFSLESEYPGIETATTYTYAG